MPKVIAHLPPIKAISKLPAVEQNIAKLPPRPNISKLPALETIANV